MHNKAKSELHLVVRSNKRVAVFQASLKLVIEEAGSQLFNKNNNDQNPMDQNVYMKGHCK